MEYGDFKSAKELASFSGIFYLSLFSSYISSLNTGNEDFLKPAVQDFNICISLCSFNYLEIMTGIFLKFLL